MSAHFETVAITQTVLDACEHLDTASLSDALDSLGINGGLPGIVSQVPGTRCVGVAFTVQYEAVDTPTAFKGAANYIDHVPCGAVIVSSNGGRHDCTVWGDIMTHFALANGIKGTVIDGVPLSGATIRCSVVAVSCSQPRTAHNSKRYKCLWSLMGLLSGPVIFWSVMAVVAWLFHSNWPPRLYAVLRRSSRLSAALSRPYPRARHWRMPAAPIVTTSPG